MNLLHLEYFYTVAKEGGFLRASEKLRIQQPSISRMVSQLEEYFGFPLFEKVGRNVRLTVQGEEVFSHCQKIFSDVEQLKLSIGKISGECKGPLMIAASEPIASYFLPDRIAALIAKYPNVYPNIFSGPAALLLKRIEVGELELGFFFHLPDISEKLTIDKQLPIKFKLVVNPKFRKNMNVLSSFIGSREIDDSSTRRFPTLEKLKKKYPDASIKISSNNLTAHKELVLKGAGVSILPEFLIQQELKERTLVDVLPSEEFVFQLKIVKRKNAVLSLPGMKVLELV